MQNIKHIFIPGLHAKYLRIQINIEISSRIFEKIVIPQKLVPNVFFIDELKTQKSYATLPFMTM